MIFVWKKIYESISFAKNVLAGNIVLTLNRLFELKLDFDLSDIGPAQF